MSESEKKVEEIEETVETAEAEEEKPEASEEEIAPEEEIVPEKAEEKPPKTGPAAEAEEGEEPEEEIEIVEEKIYIIPLRHTWVVTPRGRRAPRAVRDVRDFVARHMKAEEVAVSEEINSTLWSRSINKPPRKIKVRAVKDKEGKVIIYPAKAA